MATETLTQTVEKQIPLAISKSATDKSDKYSKTAGTDVGFLSPPKLQFNNKYEERDYIKGRLAGARMEADTCLLEHTLVMAGDVVDQGRTLQGWPADESKGSRMPTMKAKQVWRTGSSAA